MHSHTTKGMRKFRKTRYAPGLAFERGRSKLIFDVLGFSSCRQQLSYNSILGHRMQLVRSVGKV